MDLKRDFSSFACCCLILLSLDNAAIAEAGDQNLTTKKNEAATGLSTPVKSVEASAGTFTPAMRAFILWQSSQFSHAEKRSHDETEKLRAALVATLSDDVPRSQKEVLQLFILRPLVKASPKDVVELLLATEPSVQREIGDLLVEQSITAKDYEAAEQAIISTGISPGGFSFYAAAKLMQALPGTESIRGRALFARALAAFQRDQPTTIQAGNDFGLLVTQNWRRLPPQLVLEAVDALLKNAKQGNGSAQALRVAAEEGKAITFGSIVEYRIFQVLPILEELAPGRAADLARDNASAARLRQDASATPSDDSSAMPASVVQGAQAEIDNAAASIQARQREINQRAETDLRGALAAAATLPLSQPDLPDYSPRMDVLVRIGSLAATRDAEVCKDALKQARTLSATLPPWAYLHNIRSIANAYIRIGDPEEAARTLRQALGSVRKLYATDTDEDNPNLALKASWPSTFIWSELALTANKISPEIATEVLESIPDEEIKAAVSLRQIADREQVKLTILPLEIVRKK